MFRSTIRSLIGTSLAGMAIASSAHHSVVGFDNENGTLLSGTVVAIHFANPHTYVSLEVVSDSGGLESWSIESEGKVVLKRLGWHEDTIGVGDRLSVVGGRAKDGSTSMRCTFVFSEAEKPLPCFDGAALGESS